MVAGADHVLALDIPRGYWSLEDLHELARSVATTSGILGDCTSPSRSTSRSLTDEARVTPHHG
jgi:hypothetical protein